MEQIHTGLRRPEYAIAFRSIRAAKNLAATLIVLCLLTQIGATVALHFTDVLDEVVAAAPTTQPATQPAVVPAATQPTTQPDERDFDVRTICNTVMTYGLPGLRFAALPLCLLLVLMVMFAVKLSLVERVGGVEGFMSAFNWSLILLMMLIPWRPILGSSMSCGALFTFGELTSANAALGDASSQADKAIFYARFIAYPCVALFTCIIVQAKFARGYSAVDFHLDEAGPDTAPIDSPMA
jgi:hypothetical protein